jgi:hypothetical protein
MKKVNLNKDLPDHIVKHVERRFDVVYEGYIVIGRSHGRAVFWTHLFSCYKERQDRNTPIKQFLADYFNIIIQPLDVHVKYPEAPFQIYSLSSGKEI